MKRFGKECKKRKLPLNKGKAVIKSFCSTILGGELDGIAGWLMHERGKGLKFIGRSLALLSLPKVSQAAMQHWCGLFCFMASFRRPLFSLAQEVFVFIQEFSGNDHERKPLSAASYDEVLLAALLSRLAFTNLRAPLRESISITDASEQAGGSA